MWLWWMDVFCQTLNLNAFIWSPFYKPSPSLHLLVINCLCLLVILVGIRWQHCPNMCYLVWYTCINYYSLFMRKRTWYNIDFTTISQLLDYSIGTLKHDSQFNLNMIIFALKDNNEIFVHGLNLSWLMPHVLYLNLEVLKTHDNAHACFILS